MSGVVDVGDAFKLTFESLPGAYVTVDWLDPDQVAVISQEVVPPVASGSEEYAKTLTPTRSGMWTARFFAAGAVEEYFVRATSMLGQKPPLAALGDVTAQFGALSDDEQELAGYLLKAGSKLVRQRFPLVDEQADAGKLDSDVVALTVAGMVLRVLRNPEGLRSETTGPFTRAYDTSAAAGQLVMTKDDEAGVTPSPTPTTKPAGWSPAGTIGVQGGMMPPAPPRYPYLGGGYGTW